MIKHKFELDDVEIVVAIIVVVFVLGFCVYVGSLLGEDCTKCQPLSASAIADNVEHTLFIKNPFPAFMSNPDHYTIGEMKNFYTGYSNSHSRWLLEHFSYLVCYTNMTDKSFVSRSEINKIEMGRILKKPEVEVDDFDIKLREWYYDE